MVTHRLLRRLVPTISTLAVGLVLLTACSIHFTGGGHLTGAHNPKDRATIAITFNCTSPRRTRCAQATVTGHYRDPGANASFPNGVAMTFTGVAYATSFRGFLDNCMSATLNYTSEDTYNNPGSGTVDVTACQSSGSKNPVDYVQDLFVTSGPYAGYENKGYLQDGEFRGC